MLHNEPLNESQINALKTSIEQDPFFSLYWQIKDQKNPGERSKKLNEMPNGMNSSSYSNRENAEILRAFFLNNDYGPKTYDRIDYSTEEVIPENGLLDREINICQHNQLAAIQYKVLLGLIPFKKEYYLKKELTKTQKDSFLESIDKIKLDDIKTTSPFNYAFQVFLQRLDLTEASNDQERQKIKNEIHYNIFSDSANRKPKTLIDNESQLVTFLNQRLELHKAIYRQIVEDNVDAELVEKLSKLNNEISTLEQRIEQEKLCLLEQTILDEYFRLKQTKNLSNSRLTRELEYFINNPNLLDLPGKYENFDLAQLTRNLTIKKLHELQVNAPKLDSIDEEEGIRNYPPRIKRVAFVEMETLILNHEPLKLNPDLIKKLKYEYDEVILTKKYFYDQEIFKEAQKTVSLLENQGLNVRVSTNPSESSSPMQSTFDYFEDTLKAELFQANPDPLKKAPQYYQQLHEWVKAENPNRIIELSIFHHNEFDLKKINKSFPQPRPNCYFIDPNNKTTCSKLKLTPLLHMPNYYVCDTQNSYQELIPALEKYIAMRDLEDRNGSKYVNRVYNFLREKLGMPAELKIRAAKKLMAAAQWEKASQDCEDALTAIANEHGLPNSYADRVLHERFTLISNELSKKYPNGDIAELMRMAIATRETFISKLEKGKKEPPTFTSAECIALTNDRLGRLTTAYTPPKVFTQLSSSLRDLNGFKVSKGSK